MSNQAGKGDKPRNCFSKQYKNNDSQINWGKDKKFDNKRQINQTPSREGESDKKSNSNS